MKKGSGLVQTFSQEDISKIYGIISISFPYMRRRLLRGQVYNLALDFSQAEVDGLTAKDYLDPKEMADQIIEICPKNRRDLF